MVAKSEMPPANVPATAPFDFGKVTLPAGFRAAETSAAGTTTSASVEASLALSTTVTQPAGSPISSTITAPIDAPSSSSAMSENPGFWSRVGSAATTMLKAVPFGLGYGIPTGFIYGAISGTGVGAGILMGVGIMTAVNATFFSTLFAVNATYKEATRPGNNLL
jgi:hypothetical protein